METRAKSIMNHPYPEFDFDDASVQWRANKRRLPNGCYQYICMEKTKIKKHVNQKKQINANTIKHINQNLIIIIEEPTAENKSVGQKTI